MSKTPKYVSCCEDKELMSESPVSRQPKRGSFNASPITNTKLVVDDVGADAEKDELLLDQSDTFRTWVM